MQNRKKSKENTSAIFRSIIYGAGASFGANVGITNGADGRALIPSILLSSLITRYGARGAIATNNYLKGNAKNEKDEILIDAATATAASSACIGWFKGLSTTNTNYWEIRDRQLLRSGLFAASIPIALKSLELYNNAPGKNFREKTKKFFG